MHQYRRRPRRGPSRAPEPNGSAPAVVPGEAVRSAAQRAPARGEGLREEGEQLAAAVEPQLAVARAQRMAVQDLDRPALRARHALEPPEELDLLAGVERLAEAAGFAEA